MKQRKSFFLLDTGLLTILWGIAFTLPSEFLVFGLALSQLFKILAIVASLEMLGFVSYHFVGERGSIMLQGFFGGFVSSTAVFIKFSHDEKYSKLHPRSVVSALLLATIAMLIEAILIIFSLNFENAFLLSRPIFFQIATLTIFTILVRLKKSNHEQKKMSLIDHRPIIWMNVIKFGLIIVTLIFGMRLLGQKLHLPYTWSTFLLSTIEAHAVLVAALSEVKPISEMQKLIMLILIGHILSKSFIVMRGKMGKLRIVTVLGLFISLGSAFIGF